MVLDKDGYYVPDGRVPFRFSSESRPSLRGAREALAADWAAAMSDNDAGIVFDDPQSETLSGLTLSPNAVVRLEGTEGMAHGLDFASAHRDGKDFGPSRVVFSSSPDFHGRAYGYAAVFLPDYLS